MMFGGKVTSQETAAPTAETGAPPAAPAASTATLQLTARVGLRAKLFELLSDSAVYGVSSMMSRVIGFLLLPLYTQYLDTVQYGVIAMLAIVTLVFVPLANLGMTNAIFRRYNFCKNDVERRAILGTGLASVIASSLVLLGVSILGSTAIARWVVGDASSVPLVRLCLLSASISAIGAVPRIILRAARRVRAAAALNVAQVLLSVGPAVWFVVFAGLGVKGVVLGNLVGEIGTAALAFYCVWGSFRVAIDMPIWKPMLRYGLPFVPHHIQAVLLALFGQYMVREMIGLGEAGIYNVATRFALPIALIVNSVHASWVPYKFQIVAENDDPKSFFRSTLVYYVAGMSYLWVGVSLWGPEMVRMMTQQNFHSAAALVWAVGLIPLAQGVYFMLGTGIEIGDDTRQYPLISLVGLITVVVTAFALVDSAGAFGAALATALGYGMMATVIYFLAQRRYAIHYDWATLASLAAAAAVFVAIGYSTQSAGLATRLALAGLMSVAYPIVAFLLLLRSRDEGGRMRRLWRRVRQARSKSNIGTGNSQRTDSSSDVSMAAELSSSDATRPDLRTTLWAAYRVARGGGQPGLLRRKEHHRLRRIAEQKVLREAETNPTLFRTVRCPACDRPEASDTFRNPVGFTFARCAHDGSVYMNPAPTDETLSRLYNDESYTTYWSVGHAADPADYARLTAITKSSDAKLLLDVGCSTGEFLKLARGRFECYGVEINAETAKLARNSGFEIVTGTLSDVPGNERFDVVTMLQLIEHLTVPAAPLADVQRLLKPAGLLYFNTPCVDSASFALFRERHMHVSGFGHVSLFTKRGLECLAERCGFAMIEHGYCGGMDMALHDLIGYRLAPRRFRHRVGFYSPRFLNACILIDQLTFGTLAAALRPPGNPSYQWAVFQKK